MFTVSILQKCFFCKSSRLCLTPRSDQILPQETFLSSTYQIHSKFALFYLAAVSVPDPVAVYPLNSKYQTKEIKNRVPQGVAVGVSLADGPDGKAGGSYSFAGQAGSYIEFPNNGALDVQSSITMLCWVYPTGNDGPLFNYKKTGPWGVHLWIVGGQLFVRYTQKLPIHPTFVRWCFTSERMELCRFYL